MFYQSLVGEPRFGGLIDDTISQCNTLVAALVDPAARLVAANNTDDASPTAYHRHSVLAGELIAGLEAGSGSEFERVPPGLLHLASRQALVIASSVRENEGHSLASLETRRSNFVQLRRDFQLPIKQGLAMDGFAALSEDAVRLRLFETASGEWLWCEFRRGEAQRLPEIVQAYLFVASKGTFITLRSESLCKDLMEGRRVDDPLR